MQLLTNTDLYLPLSALGTQPQVAMEMSRESALVTLHAYESFFEGNILAEENIPCVVSWPGIFARTWDELVARAKAASISAAVVFLPLHTTFYGAHGSDRCYCREMYGEIKPWGCKVTIIN